jgi:WD40 repeat protein
MADISFDLARSRAILIGTGTYRYLPQVRPALNSLARMESVLTGEMCGWPPNRVVSFLDRRQPGELPDQLVELFQDAEDVALFYYVGHGQVDPSDTLCLGLVESREVPARRKTTSLPFDAVRDALIHSPARAKIVILDCCYAGLAAPGTLGGSDVSALVRGTGAFTIAAAGEFSRAWFETDETLPAPETYFTKHFVDVIERGIPGNGPELTLEPIFREVVEALARAGKPVPTSRATGHATQLVFARNAAARTPADEARDIARWAKVSPYRGMSAFGPDQAEVFYGRERLTTQLVETLASRLDRPGVLVVSGASGAGKSSLVRAGLLPALASGALTAKAATWPVRVMQPTAAPCRELARVLSEVGGGDSTRIRRALEAAPEQAHDLVHEAVLASATKPDQRLVLVVDQFEQVFTLPEDGSGRQRRDFVAALNAAATQPCGPAGEPAALVIVAVRSDFLATCATHPELTETLQDGLFLVGPMSESDLRRTITGPAQKAGLQLEPGLVESILSDLPGSPAGGYEAGALPLLSQAMRVTWENRERGWLTSRGYGLSGGVTQAIQNSAEAVYTSLTEQQRAVVPQVFDRMTKVTRDGQAVRRPMTYTRSLPDRPGPEQANIDDVVEAFAAQRLVVVTDETAEIAHDALLRAWARLRGWLEDDQANRALYSQLLDDAEEWAHHDRDPSFLYAGARLTAARQAEVHWKDAPDRYPALTGAPRAFLDSGIHAAGRRTRRRQGAFAALAGLLVIAVIAAIIAVSSARNADHQRTFAISRQLAAQSETLAGDPDTSALLAAAAWRLAPTSEARDSVIARLSQPHRATLAGHREAVRSVAFSPDGKTLATGSFDHTVRFWDVATRRQFGPPLSGEIDITSVTGLAFSPDGRTLATTSGSGAQLWDVTGRHRLGDPLTHPIKDGNGEHVYSVAFSPDGKTLATGDGDHTARLWDVATHRQLGDPFAGHTDTVHSVAFSPDGKTLATAGWDQTVRLWDVATHRQLGRPITGTWDSDMSLVFSPDSKTLATTASETVLLWDVASHHRIGAPLSGHTRQVLSVAFSPDGATLATGSDDRTARLWDVSSHQPLGAPFAGHSDSVWPVAFSPDGKTLATGGNDKTARLWNVVVPSRLIGHANAIKSVAFSHDGRVLVTGGVDRTVRLWDPATHRQLGAPFTGHTDSVSSVAISPDGKTLATGGRDETVRLWDVATRRQLGAPITGRGGNGDPVAFSPDGRILATGGFNGAVELWDVATHRRLGSPLAGHTQSVLSVAFSPDGKILATAANDHSVRLWDVAGHRPLGSPLTGHTDGVFTVAFNSKGTTLATAGGDKTVRLWDVATHRQRGTPFAGHTDGILSVAFSPDGTTLASGGVDMTVRLWDIATHRQLVTPYVDHAGPIYSVAFSPDGRTLAIGSWDPIVHLLQMTVPADLGKAICAISGRSLTREEWNRYIPDQNYRRICG